ncbi:hypothetical protein JL722_8971 [Aureococcus anophagefferens]|nr:hypothetical protein JL722_8971 [Aureococcus anophagefferens]
MFRRLVLAAATTIAAGQTFDFEDCQPEGCIFPFIYYGVTYDGCTDVDESGVSQDGIYPFPWCATAVEADGVTYDGAWIECEASNCHPPTPRPVPWPTRRPTYVPTRRRRKRRRARRRHAPTDAAAAAAADDDDELALFDAGGIAWSRSEKRTVWYRWILRSLGVLALGLLAVLEPILVVAESRVSDAQKRTLLLLSVCDAGFVACFLIELWYTRRVLFYVEVAVVACAALASAALLVRLRVVAPGLALPEDPRDRRLTLVIAAFVALDPELIPLLPWRESARNRDDAGVLRLKHFGLKHYARSFPTVFSSRVSLAVDLAKHGVTAATSIASVLAPSPDSVLEFATLAVSLAAVLANGYRRCVLLRRGDAPGAPDQGARARRRPSASRRTRCRRPSTGPPSSSPRRRRRRGPRLGSGPRRSTAWRLGERAPAPARRSTAGRPGER